MFDRMLTPEQLVERGKLAREQHAERIRKREMDMNKTGTSGELKIHTATIKLSVIRIAKCQNKNLADLRINIDIASTDEFT